MSHIPKCEDYPFTIEPLPTDEGGGCLMTFPDLPGCLADGESVEQAIAHGREVFQAWMESLIGDGKSIPEPHGAAEPATFVLRLPCTLHSRLTSRASAEAVSLNSLVRRYVAEGLRRH